MRGLLLAGGTGSRLAPLTHIVNKHLLPVGNKPMLQHPLEKMVDAGITEIMVVTGKEHAGSIINYFGSGKAFGCSITYRVQEDPDGIAGALRADPHLMAGLNVHQGKITHAAVAEALGVAYVTAAEAMK